LARKLSGFSTSSPAALVENSALLMFCEVGTITMAGAGGGAPVGMDWKSPGR